MSCTQKSAVPMVQNILQETKHNMFCPFYSEIIYMLDLQRMQGFNVKYFALWSPSQKIKQNVGTLHPDSRFVWQFLYYLTAAYLSHTQAFTKSVKIESSLPSVSKESKEMHYVTKCNSLRMRLIYLKVNFNPVTNSQRTLAQPLAFLFRNVCTRKLGYRKKKKPC